VASPAHLRARDGQPAPATSPNYDLAARWAASKVNNKMIFTVSVAPNWFETGDRFWYAFQTSKGQRWMLVDAVKKAKTPLFDPADMAAQLTNIVRIPFDSAHLPLLNLKLIKKDAALQFELSVPKDTKIPGLKEKAADTEKKETTTTTTQGQRGGAPGGAPPPDPNSRTLRFEYDLASAKVTLVHPDEVKAKEEKDKEVKWPTWASVSPDEKIAVFARKHDLYMMDMANLLKAIKDPRDPSIVDTRLTEDGDEYYQYSRHLTDDDAIGLFRSGEQARVRAAQGDAAPPVADGDRRGRVRRDGRARDRGRSARRNCRRDP